MSAKQIYWDLLHAKKKLEDFSDHAREVSETKPYNTQFTPRLLGSMVRVSSRTKDEFCGDWMLADLPLGFVVALGAAARKLNRGAK